LSQLLAAALAFAAIVASAAACGSPDPERREFVFTPVPYTPIPRGPDCAACGKAHACTAAGEGYFADRVDMTVELSREGEVTQLLNSYGFEVLGRLERDDPDTVRMVIGVPPGSALAAAALLSEESGVLIADGAGYFQVPEAPDRCPG